MAIFTKLQLKIQHWMNSNVLKQNWYLAWLSKGKILKNNLEF